MKAFPGNWYYHGFRKAAVWMLGHAIGRLLCRFGRHDFTPTIYRCHRWPCWAPNPAYYRRLGRMVP